MVKEWNTHFLKTGDNAEKILEIFESGIKEDCDMLVFFSVVRGRQRIYSPEPVFAKGLEVRQEEKDYRRETPRKHLYMMIFLSQKCYWNERI